MSRKRERSARELVSDCREGHEALKKRGVAGSCSEMSHPSSFFLSRRIWCILHSGLQQITFKARAKNGEGRKTAHGHPAGDTLGHNGDFIMLKVLPLRPPACDASFLASSFSSSFSSSCCCCCCCCCCYHTSCASLSFTVSGPVSLCIILGTR